MFRLLRKLGETHFHHYVTVIALLVLGVGLSVGKVLISIGTISLISNVFLEVLEGKSARIYQQVKSNRLFLTVLAFFLLHVVGLLWTSDFSYAFSDLKTKIALPVITLAVAYRPVDKVINRRIILYGFSLAALYISLYNFLAYQGVIGDYHYDDIRGMSLFGSHIRFGIIVAMAAAFFIKDGLEIPTKRWWLLFPVVWLVFYTYYSQVLSGVISLIAVLLIISLYKAFETSQILGKIISLVVSVFLISAAVLLGYYFFFQQKPKQDYNHFKPDKYTSSGHLYNYNSLDPSSFVNGKPVMLYVCDEELLKAWENVSDIPFYGYDKKGQYLRMTLLRYMTSMDLRKDSVGFSKLSENDIRFVENGIADVNETKPGLAARLNGLRYQFRSAYTDPNGHSLLQRLEYWKTGINIIRTNWLIGVGTGDVQQAFDREYQQNKTKLLPENRLRAHNSYITYWITFGIAGIMLFLVMNFAFLKFQLKNGQLIGLVFIAVALLTFFIEDTLETQVGICWYAFFFALFMNGLKPEEKQV